MQKKFASSKINHGSELFEEKAAHFRSQVWIENLFYKRAAKLDAHVIDSRKPMISFCKGCEESLNIIEILKNKDALTQEKRLFFLQLLNYEGTKETKGDNFIMR
jgi:hypothetical protein